MAFLSQISFGVLVVLTYVTMLMLLVAAHELGHYLFARLFGMGAEEFSIGMFGRKPIAILGKRTYTIPLAPSDDPYHRGEANPMEGGSPMEPVEVVEGPDGRVLKETTVFTIRPWPLGGFVRIKGMMPQEDGGETLIPGGFFSKSPLKRWIVLAAGPAFSVLAGILLLIPYLMFHGADDPSNKPVIGTLYTQGPASKAGMSVGDRIVSVDGKPITTFFEVTQNVRDSEGKPLTIVVDRDGKSMTFVVRGEVDKEATPVINSKFEDTKVLRKQTRLKAGPTFEAHPLAFGEAVQTAAILPVRSAVAFVSMFLHPADIMDNVGGPGTMIKMTAKSVREGLWPVVRIMAMISISLGIFNLLPVPPLDGGQMWIAFVEMLRRGRRLSMRTQMRVLNVGFAMVVAMIFCICVIDVGRLTGLTPPPKITDEKR